MLPALSNPIHRRLGILEKKKDFQKRAKHLHKKKDFIDTLKQKAFLKNPEEFAFGMIRSSPNSTGHLRIGYEKNGNPNAIKPRLDNDKRQRIKEERTDGQGFVHKFRFQRKK
jgi:hypothetical protein